MRAFNAILLSELQQTLCSLTKRISADCLSKARLQSNLHIPPANDAAEDLIHAAGLLNTLVGTQNQSTWPHYQVRTSRPRETNETSLLRFFRRVLSQEMRAHCLIETYILDKFNLISAQYKSRNMSITTNLNSRILTLPNTSVTERVVNASIGLLWPCLAPAYILKSVQNTHIYIHISICHYLLSKNTHSDILTLVFSYTQFPDGKKGEEPQGGRVC